MKHRITSRKNRLGAACAMLSFMACHDDPVSPADAVASHQSMPTALSVVGADYVMYGLNHFGSTMGHATSINDQGHVAGSEYGTLSYSQGYTDYLWLNTVDAVAVLPCCGQANELNEYDQVVGYNAPFVPYQAYLWHGQGSTGIQFLGTLPGAAMSEAWSINNGGAIVGVSGADRERGRATLWKPDAPRGTTFTTIDLGPLPGDSYSIAWGINDAAQIVGQSRSPTGQLRAVLWQPTSPGASTYTATDLGSLGGTSAWARRINGNGDIIGSSTNADGVQHAFLWRPTSPNGTTGSMTDLGPGTGYALNDRGIAVGAGATHLENSWVWTAAAGRSPLPLPSTSDTYTHAWDINNAGTIAGRIYHSGRGTSYPTIWRLNNQPPVAHIAGGLGGTEGSPIQFDGSGSSDSDGDALTFHWRLGDGSVSSEASPRHTYVEDGVYTVTLTVDDGRNGTSTTSVDVVVLNAAPVVTTVVVPIDPVQVNSAVTLKADFTEAGSADTHTGVFDLGLDGPTALGVMAQPNGSGSMVAEHTYTVPGVYTIGATVTDDEGASGSRSSTLDIPAYLVVFDPTGSFVTGGGWILSPTGACAGSMCGFTGEGKASFGFVSKYLPGRTTPAGNTEFEFRAGGFRFTSTSYEWLVVAGARAQYKGEGAVNGVAGYGFLLTGIDGAVAGGGGVDRFRIKVWSKVTGEVVYDNQRDTPEDSDASTALGGGSVVIHTK